jgi:branched-chain amino acid transport system ATP-binding protein
MDAVLQSPPATNGADTVLSVEGMAVQFGGLTAIADLSFSVRRHEIVSLIGPNGAGKTTAFNVITGFMRANGGRITYLGRSLDGLKPHQIAELGLVRTFQKTSLFGQLTTLENVLIGLHLKGKAKAWEILLALPRVAQETKELTTEAQSILNFVGLSYRASDLASSLAYGEQRLLEVAIALAARPSALLLDEPVSGMNATETQKFMVMLKKIRDSGITILLVEHDMRLVMGISDRVVVLNRGRIIAEGRPDEIQGNAEVIEAYLGHGAARAGA